MRLRGTAPFTLLLLLLTCSISLTSCTRGFVYKVFNNSGQDLVIISYDGEFTPKEYPIKSGAFADVSFPSKLVIRHPKGEWTYDLVPYKKSYEYARTGGPRVQDVQIESDGSIYLLLPRTKQAVHSFPSQFDGYPLRPK